MALNQELLSKLKPNMSKDELANLFGEVALKGGKQGGWSSDSKGNIYDGNGNMIYSKDGGKGTDIIEPYYKEQQAWLPTAVKGEQYNNASYSKFKKDWVSAGNNIEDIPSQAEFFAAGGEAHYNDVVDTYLRKGQTKTDIANLISEQDKNYSNLADQQKKLYNDLLGTANKTYDDLSAKEKKNFEDLISGTKTSLEDLIAKESSQGKANLESISSKNKQRLADLSGILSNEADQQFSESAPGILEALQSRGLLGSSDVGNQLALQKKSLLGNVANKLQEQGIQNQNYENDLENEILKNTLGLETSGWQTITGLEGAKTDKLNAIEEGRTGTSLGINENLKNALSAIFGAQTTGANDLLTSGLQRNYSLDDILKSIVTGKDLADKNAQATRDAASTTANAATNNQLMSLLGQLSTAAILASPKKTTTTATV